ncbi:cytochrome P450 family protein [Amycolatopsis pittospori]|uniref:cytochrome P450 family protein n=1 Tax=Amycolatopsis pittospori TaxID=2749434 RepID=UPI0015EFE7EF|nr:cytochrome P450 [Amycolatopsis pittospori]
MIRFDEEFLKDPASAYARLRAEGPVHRAETPDGAQVWLVTGYDDVRALLGDPRLSLDKATSSGGYRGLSLPPALDKNLLNMDAPEHTRLRKVLGKAFTRGQVERLRPRVAEIAGELLDGLSSRADLIAEYAAPLPIAVICELLGVPAADASGFRGWTDRILLPASPEDAKEALVAMYGFLTGLIAAKRAEPGEDLLGTLVTLDELTEDELLSAAFLLLFAGYENVVHQIGNGVAALLARPDQLAAVLADPALLPSTVDELLRFEPPGPLAIRRFPLEDVEIGGVTIPAGDTVMLAVASAHRDGSRFPDPDVLDVHRTENPHVGFGHGPHFCLGAPLARLELETGLGMLLKRFPGMRLAVAPEELRWRPSFRTRGLAELPVIVFPPDGTVVPDP